MAPVPVEIDVDAGQVYRAPMSQPPQHQQQRQYATDAASSTRAMAVRQQLQQQQQQNDKRGPGSSASSNSLGKGTSSTGNDEYDDDVYNTQRDADMRSSTSSGNYQRPGASRSGSGLPLSSSFNVEQMMANTSNGRDSLLVTANSLGSMTGSSSNNLNGSFHGAPRQSEYGSALMRMDDGYRSSTVHARRTAANTPSVDGLTPLLQAARVGDLVLLNSLIIQPGTDILRRDPVYGQTALHFAIRGGHLPIVQALLMPELAGSIVNVPDSRRNTALHLAAAKSRRMAKVVIDAGADVNFVNMRNQTPLGVHILTVTKDDPTMTEILLQARANPNATVDKSTALHVALDKGLLQIAQRLVRHGARLDLKDESGKMVFDKVDPALLKLLVSNVSQAPVWVPDEERTKCMDCSKPFGALGARRHHCRFCGRLLCAKCTSHQLKGSQIPFRQRRKKDRASPSKSQRVCTMCYEVNTESASHAKPSASSPIDTAAAAAAH